MYQPEHFVVGYRDDDFFKNIFESNRQEILVAECEPGIVGFCEMMKTLECPI